MTCCWFTIATYTLLPCIICNMAEIRCLRACYYVWILSAAREAYKTTNSSCCSCSWFTSEYPTSIAVPSFMVLFTLLMLITLHRTLQFFHLSLLLSRVLLVYHKTSVKRRVLNKRRVSSKRRGSEVRVLINVGSRLNAGSQINARVF